MHDQSRICAPLRSARPPRPVPHGRRHDGDDRGTDFGRPGRPPHGGRRPGVVQADQIRRLHRHLRRGLVMAHRTLRPAGPVSALLRRPDRRDDQPGNGGHRGPGGPRPGQSLQSPRCVRRGGQRVDGGHHRGVLRGRGDSRRGHGPFRTARPADPACGHRRSLAVAGRDAGRDRHVRSRRAHGGCPRRRARTSVHRLEHRRRGSAHPPFRRPARVGTAATVRFRSVCAGP